MTDFINKNDKQKHFNRVCGLINQFNDGAMYCSITLLVGHENPRKVNLSCRKHEFDKFKERFKENDKVTVLFFLTSNETKNRWYTYANILSMDLDDDVNRSKVTSSSVSV